MRRRDLVAAGAAALLAGPAGARAAGPAPTDPDVLWRLIAREQRAAVAYRAAARAGVPYAGLLARHAAQHAAALVVELASYGLEPRPPHGGARRAHRIARDFVPVALAIERDAVAAYHEAVEQLQVAKVLQTAATILASHSEQLALLEMRRDLFGA